MSGQPNVLDNGLYATDSVARASARCLPGVCLVYVQWLYVHLKHTVHLSEGEGTTYISASCQGVCACCVSANCPVYIHLPLACPYV